MNEGVFIETTDPRWAAQLSVSPHDLYHLPAYATLEADWTGARAIAFLYRENRANMLLVLLEKSLPGGEGTDVVTPYGYSCPVMSPGSDAAFLQRALIAYHNAARDRGILTTFMRLHPLLAPEIENPPQLPCGSWVQEQRGATLAMPLDGDEHTFLRHMASGHRADVRRLSNANARLVIDTADVWNAFPDIYRHTMEKVGASAGYYYSDDYIGKLRRELDGIVHCVGIADKDGELMCAALFTEVGPILQYHLSGTAEGYTRQAPMKMLLAGMRDWAVDRRISWFHLGGGLGGARDSLYYFKQKFGGPEFPFRTVSIVHDNEQYNAHVARLARVQNVDLTKKCSFFPRYRAPDLTGQNQP